MGLLALITQARAGRDAPPTDSRSAAPAGHWSRQCLALAIAILSWAPLALEARDRSDIERIDRVKAAFILNIARFVTWPPEVFADQPGRLSLCLYRGNPLAPAIETLHGKKVGGRRLEITHIMRLAEADACQILLLAPYQLDEFAAAEHARPGPPPPLLTIADVSANHDPQTRHHHILVSLIRSGTHIGFEINLAKARQAGLRLSSRLLKLARIVGNGD